MRKTVCFTVTQAPEVPHELEMYHSIACMEVKNVGEMTTAALGMYVILVDLSTGNTDTDECCPRSSYSELNC
jgi:hypothetical protein